MNNTTYGESEGNISSSLDTLSQVCFVLLYSITILVSLSGNILLIFIVKWRPQARSLTGVLFVNMAVADIFVTLAVMPDSMSFVFTLGKWFPGDLGLVTCAGVRYLNFISLAASIGSLLLMSVDRYLGVTFPLHRFPKFRRGRILSLGIWLSATITSIPVAVTWKNFKYFPNDTTYVCAPLFQSPGKNYKRISFYLYFFLVMYLIPLFVISTLYFSVCRQLRKRNIPGVVVSETKHRNEATKRKVVRRLMIITAVFAICWLPSQVYIVILGLFPRVHDFQLPGYVQYLFFWLGHANSAINPWLCLTLNGTLRKALCEVVKRDRHSNSRYSKSTRSQTSTKYTSVKNAHINEPPPNVQMERKKIHCALNEEKEQIWHETNV